MATVRRARTADVDAIAALVTAHSGAGLLLEKNLVTLFEDVQEFLVADDAGRVVGCGALHVLWRDLAEVRTLVVDPACRGRGIGGALLTALLDGARELGVGRVFCLTFETAFFAAYGFRPIEGVPVDQAAYEEMLRSYDDGVAEFLDLERVKPNTLGNTRMLAVL
ncbi:MAG TPA: amino-acid N-acetyltransferase [Frankiaceae bacterium]|nr:amino-acid N-acetyltransferase [Frankiaceae bacterium]